MAGERHSDLLGLLLANGQTPVQEIADRLGASLATVRRDLNELEKIGRVERLHGAARISQGAHKEIAFQSRENVNLPAKRAIAVCAAEQIQPDATIFLDSSTTVLQLARHIANIPRPTSVFTNSLTVAQELAPCTHITLVLIGGRVRSENLSMVGSLTLKSLRELWFDQLFLGATAIDNEGNLTSLDADEAAANELMLERSNHGYILADASKLNSRTTHIVAQLGKQQTLICEAAVDPQLVQTAQESGLEILQASHD